MAPPLTLLFFGALLAPAAAQPPVANASAAQTVQVTVGVLLPERNLGYPFAWPRVSPALSLVLEELQPLFILAGRAFRIAFASTEGEKGTCDSNVAHLSAMELKSSHDPDVLLGLGCFYGSNLVTPFANHWFLPLLRAGAYQMDRDGSTELYLGPLGPSLRAFQAELQRHFGWSSGTVLLLMSSEVVWQHYPSFTLRPEEHLAEDSDYVSREDIYQQPDKAIGFIQDKGRVVYICGSLEMLQEIMHHAQAQNMTNGDYIFLFLDIFGESLRAEGHREAGKPWQSKESNDTGDLRQAFQTVLVITPYEPRTPKYRHFENQLILRAQRDFGVSFNDSMGHLVAGCFYDGLLLYIRALEETLREGLTKRDTLRILHKMKGQRFQGVTGTVSMNSKGVREMDFELWAMRDVESGDYQVMGHYVGSKKQINWLKPIYWNTGRPPCVNQSCVFSTKDPSYGTVSSESNQGISFLVAQLKEFGVPLRTLPGAGRVIL